MFRRAVEEPGHLVPHKKREDRNACQRRWYANNRQKHIRMVRDHQHGVIAKYKQFKEGQSCIRCGESDVDCLTFHHRDPEQKRFNIGEVSRLRASWPTILRELAKCDCLCANCHMKLEAQKRRNGGPSDTPTDFDQSGTLPLWEM